MDLLPDAEPFPNKFFLDIEDRKDFKLFVKCRRRSKNNAPLTTGAHSYCLECERDFPLVEHTELNPKNLCDECLAQRREQRRQIHCDVCQVPVSRNDWEEHVKGFKHLNLKYGFKYVCQRKKDSPRK